MSVAKINVENIYENVPLVELGVDGIICFASPAFLAMVGYSVDNSPLTSFGDLVAPHDKAAVGTALSGGRKCQRNLTLRHLEGRVVEVNALFAPVGDNGRDSKFLVTMIEVSRAENSYFDKSMKMHAIEQSYATVEFDLDGLVITANSQFTAVMKYHDLAEIKGKHHRIFVRQRDQTEDYERFWADLRKGLPKVGLFLRVAKDGTDIYIQASYCPVKDNLGRVYKVLKIASDVTEAKKKELESNGQMAYAGASYAIIEFDLDGVILSANELLSELLQYSQEELIGQHHRIFVPPGDLGAGYKEHWAKIRSGEVVLGEFRRIAKDGSEVYIRACYTPILNFDGEPFKVVKFVSDITQAKQREVANEGEVEALRRVAAVSILDLEGQFVETNDNFAAFFEPGHNSLVGRRFTHYLPTSEARAVHESHMKSLLQGQPIHAELACVSATGAEMHLQVHYSPLYGPSGRLEKIFQIAFDSTHTTRAATEVGKTAQTLDKNSTSLADTASSLHSIAGTAVDLAERSLNGIRATEGSVENLSSMVSDMKNMVQGVLGHTRDAGSIAADAVRSTDEVNRVLEELNNSSLEIGQVVKLITSVAAQTNLLALNATIEAARAGDSGKGFAVVANEVKELAKKTARATEEIAARIQTIQSDTEITIKAVAQITETIAKITQSQGLISSSIQEQGRVAEQVAHEMKHTADGARVVSGLIERLSHAAQDTSLQAEGVRTTSDGLSSISQNLLGLIDTLNLQHTN